MAAIAGVVSMIGTGVSIYGQIQKANADAAAAKYNSDLDLQNAQLAREQGAQDELKTRVMGRKVLGDMRADYGASGVTATSGSALDVLQESAANAEMDALNVKHRADITAAGYEADAKLGVYRGQAAQTAGYVGAASSLLRGTSDFLDKVK